MKLASFTLAATLLMTTVASAQSAVDSVRSQLSDQGYTVTDVSRNGSQYTVSSQGNGRSRQVTFDADSGEVLADDFGNASGSQNVGRDDNGTNDNDHGRGNGNDNEGIGHDSGESDSGNSDSGNSGHDSGNSDGGNSGHDGGSDGGSDGHDGGNDD